ncbi:MAG: patatin-like phospholipase family protein [Deltaproteobacteria bacterium]|nr:patatin-like phospholipase family protein [Deltaproteobacteria bacterium]
MIDSGRPYDALVFAGGGCRCFWQVGFLEAAWERAALAPRHVVAVSAGAAMAVMVFGGRVERGRARFAALTAANPANVYPRNLLGADPVFPHLRMYRDVLLDALDAGALAALAAGPPLDVLLARPPRRLPRLGALLVGFGAYALERRLRDGVHPSWPRALGYAPELVRVQDVLGAHAGDARAAAEALTTLVLASSCTPPVTPFLRYTGRPVLDGGLVDNVPAFAVPAHCERALVLLTRRYPTERLGRDARRRYVQPSRPIPLSKWDYTRPDLLQETYDLGRRDGERFEPDAA